MDDERDLREAEKFCRGELALIINEGERDSESGLAQKSSWEVEQDGTTAGRRHTRFRVEARIFEKEVPMTLAHLFVVNHSLCGKGVRETLLRRTSSAPSTDLRSSQSPPAFLPTALLLFNI